MASWFSEGTVRVQSGSPTVVGTGTKFSNSRAGDMFVGPDQGIYQVINPASDTSLSISPAYRGAAAVGAGYGIVPVNGYPKALADAVNLFVQQWGATLAGLGSVSTENVVPVAKGGTGGTTQATAQAGLGLGTAATGTTTTSTTDYTPGRIVRMGDAGVGAMASPPWPNTSLNDCSGVPQGRYATTGATTDLPPGAAVGTVDFGIRNSVGFEYTMTHLSRSGNVLNTRTAVGGSSSSPGWTSWGTLVKGGSNSTITSLTGLTTALSIDQGGTGNNTGTASKLSGAGILGTVSQSGGVPTGSIIEKGSTATGEYTKFADGTMICRLAGQAVIDITTGYGGSKYGLRQWIYPASFVATPSLSSVARNASQLLVGTILDLPGIDMTSSCTFCYVDAGGVGANVNTRFTNLAIGRWF